MMKENQRIVIHRIGESFRAATKVINEPIPEPLENEVVIRNHFAGVNAVYDQMMCFDRIDHFDLQLPAPTGVEACGEVIACGSAVGQFKPGDKVASVVVGNGYSLFQCCKESDVIPIPDASAKMLALIPSGVSAMLALEQVGQMNSDEVVCVSAAAGGLGNIMVQLAVAAGNHVVAICGDDAKARVLSNLGAARVIQYRREDVAAVIDSEYKDRLDLIMESVGGGLFDTLVDNLAPFGRLVVCGFTSDRLPTEQVQAERIYTKLYWKAASIRGFMNYRFAEHAPDARERLIQAVEGGSLDPLIDDSRFVGLANVADAVEHLLAGKNLGKVVVDLRPDAA